MSLILTGGFAMPFLTMRDGTEIFYKDWGAGQPVIFSHGWPLTADMWDNQMMFFGNHGFRVIAFDRRGFGRSGQNWDGNDYDRAADDLAALIETLDLHAVVLVGHSMAGGEFARYVSRHGTSRLRRIVTSGANLPQILQTAANPEGTPISVFDEMRAGVLNNRAAFLKTMPAEPFGFNRLTHKTDAGLMESFWRQGMMAGVKAAYDFIAQFSETDFTEELKKFDIPTLIIHGDDDQGTPIKATALRAATINPHATLKVYEGGTHMIPILQADQFNTDVLAFIRE
jgi:non-heme chloroperoxidase